MFEAKVLKVFIASPGDTKEERSDARSTIARWNAAHAANEKVVLLPIGWESHSVPEWGDHPQAILNRQLVDDADILIGVIFTKLGTPTPNGRSGTVEEIERFAKAGKPVLLYFCRKHVDLSSVDLSQYEKVREFEASCQAIALYDTYSDTTEFANKLERHLLEKVRQVLKSSATSPRPEARVVEVSAPAAGRRLTRPPERIQEPRLAGHLENYGSRSKRFVIRNAGTVDIHDVNIEVPKEVERLRLHADELPVEILRPGEAIHLLASESFGGGPSIFDVFLTGQTRTTTKHDDYRFPIKISL